MRSVEKCLVGGYQWCFEIKGGIRFRQPFKLQVHLAANRNQTSVCIGNVIASNGSVSGVLGGSRTGVLRAEQSSQALTCSSGSYTLVSFLMGKSLDIY